MRRVPVTKITFDEQFKNVIKEFEGKNEFDRANALLDFILENTNEIEVEKREEVNSVAFNASKEKTHKLKEIASKHNMKTSTYINEYLKEYYGKEENEVIGTTEKQIYAIKIKGNKFLSHVDGEIVFTKDMSKIIPYTSKTDAQAMAKTVDGEIVPITMETTYRHG